MTYEEVIENIRKRDENDKAKEIGALKKAKDSIVIDTTKLTIEEVVEKIIEIIDKAKISFPFNLAANFSTKS